MLSSQGRCGKLRKDMGRSDKLKTVGRDKEGNSFYLTPDPYEKRKSRRR
jgi:hypothetical protein